MSSAYQRELEGGHRCDSSAPMRRRARRMRGAADGGGEGGEAVARQQRGELLLDAPDEPGSLVDERGVELDEARPGADFLIGVGAQEIAAAANRRKLAPGRRYHPASHRGEGAKSGLPLKPPGSCA